jgi:putative spermidine/putrescine transport system substrate-binding protein
MRGKVVKCASSMSRRRFIASVTALAAPAVWTSARAAQRIVIRDAGGPFPLAFQKAFYEPFKAATGIECVPVTASSEPTAQIRAIVESGSGVWDMANLTEFSTLQVRDFLEPHGLENNPIFRDKIPGQFKNDKWIGNDVYSCVLAYRTDVYKPEAAPRTWADFWNVGRFPGRRALSRSPLDTLEIALIADGVEPTALYPLDIDRAFRSLDKIRKHVTVWFQGGTQSTQLMLNKEVDMCQSWGARAKAAADAGAPVGMSLIGSLWIAEGWVILKNTPNLEACRKFIAFAIDAERQAAFTPYLAYGPTNVDAFKFIDPTIARILPTYPDNLKTSGPVDAVWREKNKEMLIDRYNKWLLG